jgi:hypothetical protein
MCEGNRPGQGYYWEEGVHEMMAEKLGPILVMPSFEASTLHKDALEKSSRFVENGRTHVKT